MSEDRRLTQEEIDYHTLQHLQLAHALLERIGESSGSKIADGYVEYDPNDHERGDFYTELGGQTWDATRKVLGGSARFLANVLRHSPGDLDTKLLYRTQQLATVGAAALKGDPDPDVATGLLDAVADLLPLAEAAERVSDRSGGRVEVEEVAHV